MNQQKSKLRYITGIDGLRTFAVLGVIGYHLLPNIFKGGYLGVPLFFVISGFLMTNILYHDATTTNRIRLKRFYWHRIRRLVPPLAVMLVICGAVLVWFPGQLLNNFRGITLSSLLNYNNWWQLAHGASYFDKFTQESPFTNLWSLSVEGQFYLLWPLVLGFMFYFVSKKNLWKWISLGAIASAVEMAILYQPNNLNRVYYGTDTRLFSLLIGCLLAIVINLYPKMVQRYTKKAKGVAIGITALVITFGCFFVMSDKMSSIYRGGMFLFSIVCAFLLLAVIQSPIFNRLMTNPIFHYIGTRSYEIYLWQFPVMIAFESVVKPTGSHQYINMLIELAIILLLSEISYQLVRHGMKAIRQWKDNHYKIKLNIHKRGTIASLILLLLVSSSFIYGFTSAPVGQPKAAEDLKAQLAKKEKELKKQQKEAKKPKSKEQKQKDDQEIKKAGQSDDKAALTKTQIQEAQNLKITAVGDSVLLDAAPSIMKLAPNSDIDAVVGRQLKESLPILQQKVANGTLAPNVVIALGTNGEFDQSDLDQLIKTCGKRQIFLVNTLVPRYWQDKVNQMLEKTAKKHKNVHLVDWNSIAKNNPEWFGEDGVHMGPLGSQIYANYLIKSILKVDHQ